MAANIHAAHLKWAIPVVMLILLLAGNTAMWRQADYLADSLARKECSDKAREIISTVENALKERSSDLSFIAHQWQSYEADQRHQRFIADAKAIAERESRYFRISYVDLTGEAQISVWPEALHPQVTYSSEAREACSRFMEQARATAHPISSSPVALSNGQPGMVMWAPVEGADGEVSGLIEGIMALDQVTGRIRAIESPEVCAQVTIDGQQAYSSVPPEMPPLIARSPSQLERSSILGREINVEVRLCPEGYLAALPRKGILHFGVNVVLSLLTAVMLALLLFYIQRIDQARSHLRKSEERYRILFDSAADAIIITDLAGAILEVNRVACKRLGLEEDVLLAMRIQDVCTDTREGMPDIFKIGTGDDTVFETICTTHDGQVLYQELSSKRIKHRDMDAVMFIARDVGRRKAAEQALMREKERAQNYLNTANVMFLGMRLDGTITLANKRACEVLGYSEAELQVTSVFTLLPEENQADMQLVLNNIAAGRTAEYEYIENTILTRDGDERLIAWHNSVVRNGAGEVVGVLSSGQDVTQERKAEAAIRASEEQYRLIVETAYEGIWQFAPDRRIIFANPRLAEMLGCSVDELTGRQIYDFLDDEWHNTADYYITRREQGYADSFEFKMKRADGSPLWVLVNAGSMTDAEGNYAGALSMITDMTAYHNAVSESKRLEEQVRQQQKVESLGRLAGGVAHDLNNLLSPILGYAELALMSEELDPQLRERLNEILGAAERAKELTWQLLAFGRKQVLDVRTINLSEVVQQFEKLLRISLREDIALTLDLAPDLALCNADRAQMEQVLMNLTVNSQDAMPDGGRLSIHTENVWLDEEYALQHAGVAPGQYVLLTVSDTGCGMDQETLEHIFEPFFTTKKIGKGTGLGMATVHGIINQHNGHINVYSEPGKGTTVRVYIPVTSASQKADTSGDKDVPAVTAGGTEFVMVVEDDEAVRALSAEILGRHGYKVETFSDAYDALAWADKHTGPIDLLLTDVVMPQLNGKEVYERLLGKHPELRVLYMSGYTDDVIAYHGILERGTHFVQKPFTVHVLTQKVRETLDSPEGPAQ